MSTDVELTIEQRVAAGAAWLDENRPDWMDRIFLNSLDVSDCTLCVLGQVYGGWMEAPDDAKYDEEDEDYLSPARVRGFEKYGKERYEALTAEWRRLIESRRAEVE